MDCWIVVSTCNMVIMFGIVTFGQYTSDRMLPAIFSPHWTHHKDDAVFKVNIFLVSLLPRDLSRLIKVVNVGLKTFMAIHTHSLWMQHWKKKVEKEQIFPASQSSDWTLCSSRHRNSTNDWAPFIGFEICKKFPSNQANASFAYIFYIFEERI